MPAIAAGALRKDVQFYWHLGDFRAIYKIDEDFANQDQYAKPTKKDILLSVYLGLAWPDFIERQIRPFGRLPVFLGIGNHETAAPKTREEFIVQFSAWLNSAQVQRQRAEDYRWDWQMKTYFHWKMYGVDFINLDNATGDQFDQAQLSWFETILDWDAKDEKVQTIVVGMHKALPCSWGEDHSMTETATGQASGRRVYEDLLKMQEGTFLNPPPDKPHKKKVYVLASHSHYYMEDIFRTSFWEGYGHDQKPAAGLLKGWIVGTAGAQRIDPPVQQVKAGRAKGMTYGYLIGEVQSDGTIDFDFQEINIRDVPMDVRAQYSRTPDFVDWCFTDNKKEKEEAPKTPAYDPCR